MGSAVSSSPQPSSVDAVASDLPLLPERTRPCAIAPSMRPENLRASCPRVRARAAAEPASQHRRRRPSALHLAWLPISVLLSRPGEASARSWADYVSTDSMTTDDPVQHAAGEEMDPMKITEMPSTAPSADPSIEPTLLPSIFPSTSFAPSVEPTSLPSTVPSLRPTQLPSAAPSHLPSVFPSSRPTPSPSAAPTHPPTVSHKPTMSPTSITDIVWDNAPVPRKADAAYFDYNTRRSAPYGPGYPEIAKHNRTHTKVVYRNNHWSKVRRSAEWEYWREFKSEIKENLDENMCGKGGRQSPIDVRPLGACEEHHQIRHWKGDFRVDSNEITKQILPSKLRLVFPRRTGEEPDPPHADFPHGWGGTIDALHADVKAPSEHWIRGRQYVAEYQIYHLHRTRKKAPVISIVIDLHPDDEPNVHFQRALDEWQKVFDADYLDCEDKKRRRRRADASLFKNFKDALFGEGERAAEGGGAAAAAADLGFSTWADEPPEEEERFQHLRRRARRASLLVRYGRAWDPYSPELMRSNHFYGYSGSLTEPPCSQFVEWRVIDTPMLVSKRQLFQIRRLLFGHVDGDCDLTSNHFYGSVARPLQDVRFRPVYQCTCRDFLSDDERDLLDRSKCSPKQYEVYHNASGGEW